MSSKSGIAAALEEDGGPQIGDRQTTDEPRQLSLVSDDELAQDERDELAQPWGLDLPKGRGVGRPKGSRNKSTEQTKDVIRLLGGDPQLALARMVAGGPAWIMAQAQAAHIARTGCKVNDDGLPMECGKVVVPIDAGEATKLWQTAATNLAPYMMARAVKVEGDSLAALTVQIFGGDMPAAGPDIGGDDQGSGARFSWPMNSDTYEGEAQEVAHEKSHDEEEASETAGSSANAD